MEWHSLLEITKNIGFPGVIVLIWYLTHRSFINFLEQLLDENRYFHARILEDMNSFREVQEYHAARLSSIETKIDTNQFCPISRKEVRP